MHLKTKTIKDALEDNLAKYYGKTFQHYKGGVYKITGTYFDTALDEPGLLYERVDGMHFNQLAESGVTFGRPISVFESLTEEGSHRFVRVRQEKVWTAI